MAKYRFDSTVEIVYIMIFKGPTKTGHIITDFYTLYGLIRGNRGPKLWAHEVFGPIRTEDNLTNYDLLFFFSSNNFTV